MCIIDRNPRQCEEIAIKCQRNAEINLRVDAKVSYGIRLRDELRLVRAFVDKQYSMENDIIVLQEAWGEVWRHVHHVRPPGGRLVCMRGTGGQPDTLTYLITICMQEIAQNDQHGQQHGALRHFDHKTPDSQTARPRPLVS